MDKQPQEELNDDEREGMMTMQHRPQKRQRTGPDSEKVKETQYADKLIKAQEEEIKSLKSQNAKYEAKNASQKAKITALN